MARDVTLLIKLNDQASGKISKITNSTKQLERAANGAQNSIRRTNKGIRETGRVADKASKGVNNLGKAVRGLVAGFGLFQAGKFVIFKTAELERQTKSLEVLTGSLGNARNIISELQQFGAVTPFTSSELVETAKRLKAFGFETEQIVDVTKRLADVAGATGADLGGIATAFGQIQAKGRLQGEELLQLQERGVSLQDELQRMYGLTADEFRKALEGGRISANAVNLALQNITDTGGKYANGAIAQSETLAGKFSTLQDNIQRLAEQLGRVLAPVLKGILNLANEALAGINRVLTSETSRTLSLGRAALLTPGGTLGDLENLTRDVLTIPVGTLGTEDAIKSLFTELQALDAQQKAVSRTINTTRGATDAEIDAFERLGAAIFKVQKQLGQRQLAVRAVAKEDGVIDIPDLLKGTGGGGGGGETAAEIARKNAQQRIARLREEAAIARGMTTQEKNMLKLKQEISQAEENRALVGDNLTNQLIEQLEVTFGTKEVAQALLDLKQRQKQAEEDASKAAEDALKRQQAEAQRLEQLFGGIGQTISTGIVDALMDAKNATQALGGMLQSVGKQLLQLGVNSLLQAAFPGSPLFSGLLGFANGGRPPVGRPSVVGERGPELFVPDRAGTILPNGVGMGSTTITVNVDASDTSADASSGSGAQLGKAIGLAVQQELLKQKRPGGLLAGV